MSSQWKHKALTWAKPQTFQGLSPNTCNALGREALVMTLEADHGQLRLIFCRQHKSKFLVNSIYKAFPFVFKNPSCLFLGGTWFEFATWICIPQNCSSETPSTCFFFFLISVQPLLSVDKRKSGEETLGRRRWGCARKLCLWICQVARLGAGSAPRLA